MKSCCAGTDRIELTTYQRDAREPSDKCTSIWTDYMSSHGRGLLAILILSLTIRTQPSSSGGRRTGLMQRLVHCMVLMSDFMGYRSSPTTICLQGHVDFWQLFEYDRSTFSGPGTLGGGLGRAGIHRNDDARWLAVQHGRRLTATASRCDIDRERRLR